MGETETILKDFFFEDSIIKQSDGIEITLTNFENFLMEIPALHVANQLNRLLSTHNVFSVVGGNTGTKFGYYVDAIGEENIAKLKIFMTKEVLGDQGPTTFGIDFYLTNGIVRVLPHWNGRNWNRFEETLRNMLIPIYRTDLWSRTVIDVPAIKLKRLPHVFDQAVLDFIDGLGGFEEYKESYFDNKEWLTKTLVHNKNLVL